MDNKLGERVFIQGNPVLDDDGATLVWLWMDIGIFDIPSLLSANRRMHRLLETQGYPVSYREYNAGHNYPAWRDDVWRGLMNLFPA